MVVADDVDLMTLLAGLGKVAQESNRQANLASDDSLSSESADPDDPTCPITDVCPARHSRHPKSGHKPWSNGCGSAGMDLKDGWGLTKCCDEHDFCYSTCNSKRSTCDRDFASCMENVCKKVKSKKGKQECSSTAGMYNFGASGFGCSSYIESQKEACECIPDHGFQLEPDTQVHDGEMTLDTETETETETVTRTPTPAAETPQSKPPPPRTTQKPVTSQSKSDKHPQAAAPKDDRHKVKQSQRIPPKEKPKRPLKHKADRRLRQELR